MSYRHDGVMEWMLANPHLSRKDCAKEFNFTPSYISNLTTSDLFQQEYQRRCEEQGQVAVFSFESKLRGIATLALDKTEERLKETQFKQVMSEDGKVEVVEESAVSEKFLVDTTKNILASLGYINGNKREPEVSTSFHIHVNAEALAEAREVVNVTP